MSAPTGTPEIPPTPTPHAEPSRTGPIQGTDPADADSEAATSVTAAPGPASRRTAPRGADSPSPGRRLSPRARRWLVALVVLGLFAVDLSRPPADQLSARFLLAGIHLYQATLSENMGRIGVHCRFRPTCSHYAEGAIEKDGALVGSLRAVWRIARCGPWTPAGTVDPP